MKELRWSRAVLKLSGELLGGREGPLDYGALSFFAREIKKPGEAGGK